MSMIDLVLEHVGSRRWAERCERIPLPPRYDARLQPGVDAALWADALEALGIPGGALPVAGEPDLARDAEALCVRPAPPAGAQLGLL